MKSLKKVDNLEDNIHMHGYLRIHAYESNHGRSFGISNPKLGYKFQQKWLHFHLIHKISSFQTSQNGGLCSMAVFGKFCSEMPKTYFCNLDDFIY